MVYVVLFFSWLSFHACLIGWLFHILMLDNNYWIYSADLGLPGFPAKDLHYSFLPQFTLVFYIQIRDYSKVTLLYWMFSKYWSYYTTIDIDLESLVAEKICWLGWSEYSYSWSYSYLFSLGPLGWYFHFNVIRNVVS